MVYCLSIFTFCIYGQINKLTLVFYESVLILMINSIIALSKWLWNHETQASGFAANFDSVITKFINNKRRDAKKKKTTFNRFLQ